MSLSLALLPPARRIKRKAMEEKRVEEMRTSGKERDVEDIIGGGGKSSRRKKGDRTRENGEERRRGDAPVRLLGVEGGRGWKR